VRNDRDYDANFSASPNASSGHPEEKICVHGFTMGSCANYCFNFRQYSGSGRADANDDRSTSGFLGYGKKSSHQYSAKKVTTFLIVFVLIICFSASLFLGGVFIKFGKKMRLVNAQNISSIGGVAVLFTWWIAVLLIKNLKAEMLWPLLMASLLILLIGLWDTRRPLGPIMQLLAQISIAAVPVFFGGLEIKYLTNPFGGVIDFTNIRVFGLLLPSAVITLVWIVTLMNAVNFLDGMDGLAGSVSIIAFVVIGLVSLLPQVNDSGTAVAAFAAAAALLGFIFWNYPPAPLILGTVGSWFIGFLIAFLSVQGATKVATVAVVGAVPLLDALVVVFGRLWRKQSPFKGDRTHLHHRLKRRGLSDRAILAIYMVVSIGLGCAAVILQTQSKILVFYVFSALFVFLIYLGSITVKKKRKE
jgi:UDP-GlcNAc:undecaprenyl-phosphate GlcNAc-1-phosphate transferase